MRLKDQSLAFSPSDLSAFVACPHLTVLQVRVARGELDKPFRHNPHGDLIARKGDEHETRYLEQLIGEGRDVVTIERGENGGWDLERAAEQTEQAMRDGADVIYQGVLMHENWRGLADFLFRVPNETALGDYGYEALDTKLARRAKPAHVLQLCFYTEQIARIQGRMPGAMHVVAGTGERESFRPDDYMAYYRRLRDRFVAAVENGAETYPYPVAHCSLCDFLALCKDRWREDDHLSAVANIMRAHVERLNDADITTLEALAKTAAETKIAGIRPEILARLREQAELQLHRRETGELKHVVLPVEPERGFALMPKPSPGDIWLDLEGDPFYEPARGIDYLFGWIYLDHGVPVYDCIWATDFEAEKEGFERLMRLVGERRRAHPDMHVYHYATYERSALQRLMGAHATCEEEVDDLLRGEVLVDLFQVVRQALRLSLESYSIKKVEEFYAFKRSDGVAGGDDSTVAFEEWLETREQSILDGIRAYNEDDCRSLYELHQWLLRLRPPELEWRVLPAEREVPDETKERLEERERLRERLLEGAEEGDPRWLLAHLLEYHRREEKPQWWEYFHHLELEEDELLEDTDTIGGITAVGEPEEDKQSLIYTLAFPAQEHGISGECIDPATEKGYNVRVDDERGLITLRRGRKRADEPLPQALIPIAPIGAYKQRDAVKRFAESYLEGGGYPALVELLERRPPRARLDAGPIAAAESLDGSYLFVQGPPGSGKTYTGARMAIDLMRRGQRVGVTALSHKAIHKFLEDVRDAARESGFSFKGRKKGGGDEETMYEDEFVDATTENGEMLDRELRLLAGTAWLFSREEFDGHVDTLFIDEGGQISLADAIAVGTAARNLVLLGDPNQLPQVSQGSHPEGTKASVLQHLLRDGETVQSGMGLFLAETYRMRPEVNDYISETFYEGRLRPADVAYRRSVHLGNGIRFLSVEHEGARTQSPAEASAVADEVARLLGTPYDDGDGVRVLEPKDVVVVAPYNAHVRCLRQKIPDPRVRIGTVDKFQGQQAAVVFYSMASSSAEDVPRGLDFLFSRNRLNVAISRAKCLAYLVASPRLLDANCRTVEQMRLANALCRLVDVAEPRRTA